MSITTKLQGGTGNQMFQYAMGYVQARRFNTELIIDIEKFKNDPMREYTLSLFPRITNKIVDNAVATIGEEGMPYNNLLIKRIKDGDVLNGYWQTAYYFIFNGEGYTYGISGELRELFQPKPLTTEQRRMFRTIKSFENSTFLVIRRTDYVGNSFHGELSMDYYNTALMKIHEKTGKPPSVFVFSDEPEWCSKNLKLDYSMTIAGTFDRTVKGHIGREDADLYLMSQCKNAVIANSSFAWWGAFLGDKDRKGVVVAPLQWFGPTSKENPRDIIPSHWIKI